MASTIEKIEKEIERIFWQTDTDRSGTISLRELQRVLEENGYKLTNQQLQVCAE